MVRDPGARGYNEGVASRAEAWIETSGGGASSSDNAVASRAEAWIETRTGLSTAALMVGRLPRGGVD